MSVEVLVLYYSRYGSVAAMARQIARGVGESDAIARLRTVPAVSANTKMTEADIPDSGPPYATVEDLEECDGLILGSPTRFGNMAAPLKYFLDGTGAQWMSATLEGKPAGVFTASASLHGGQESTLLSMALPLIHHGCLFVGVPYSVGELNSTRSGGTPYGASHVSFGDKDTKLSGDEERICRALGRRVGRISTQLKAEAG